MYFLQLYILYTLLFYIVLYVVCLMDCSLKLFLIMVPAKIN